MSTGPFPIVTPVSLALFHTTLFSNLGVYAVLCWQVLPLTVGTLSPQSLRSKKYWVVCPKISLNQDPVLCTAPVGHLKIVDPSVGVDAA